MGLTFESPYPQTIKTKAVKLTSANGGTRAAPTNLALLAEAGADGALLSRLEALAQGDTTATEIQVYSSTDNGASYTLVRSVIMSPQTASVTTPRASAKFEDISENAPLYMQGGERLYATLGAGQAAGIAIRASWANY